MTNFDEIIDRSGSLDVKHELLQQEFGRSDLLPLWVADMDFATPYFIREALMERLRHPIYGYTVFPKDYWTTIARWIWDHHQWRVEPEWMRYIPGIVKGIGFVLNVFTEPGDKVIIQPPVYHPFRITPQQNGREVVWNPLVMGEDGNYDMDFDNLARVCDERCKVLILCNPHNPAGRVWPRETLIRLADFCKEHHLLVISDEIHCDMALFGHKHIPFASVSDAAAEISITFQAPSKTFNIAGIVSSYAIVPNAKLRRKFYHWTEANELNDAPFLAMVATMAAYKKGEPWRQEMLRYVEQNVEFVESYCKDHLPQLRVHRPQASYLVWIDCRGLGLTHDQLIDLFVNRARLALNDGAMFGPGGEGFMRLNVGCPRSVLQQALRQLEEAVGNK